MHKNIPAQALLLVPGSGRVPGTGTTHPSSQLIRVVRVVLNYKSTSKISLEYYTKIMK
jgi:hypothetical protein